MTPQQLAALEHPRRLTGERHDPRFRLELGPGSSLVLTVDLGEELAESRFGGPVWHASVSSELGESAAWVLADRALEGVGDSSLGEWVEEDAGGAVHVRRRLSVDEARRAGVRG